MPLVEGSEKRRTARGALAPPLPATAQDLLRCLRLDRHFFFCFGVFDVVGSYFSSSKFPVRAPPSTLQPSVAPASHSLLIAFSCVQTGI